MLSGKILKDYFKLVAEHFQDTVAKAIMCYLVDTVRKGMHSYLTNHLNRDEVLSRVFEESEATSAIRQEHQRKLEVSSWLPRRAWIPNSRIVANSAFMMFCPNRLLKRLTKSSVAHWTDTDRTGFDGA